MMLNKSKLIMFFIVILSSAHIAIAQHNNQITIPSIDLKYSNQWIKFKNFTAKNLDQFVNRHEELQGVKSVFYPFGGADIIYPLITFPQVTQITLVGLENLGSVPNAKQNTLLIASKDVKSLLKRSFFITEQMLTNNFGILNLLLEQLQLLKVQNVLIEVFDPIAKEIKIKFTYQGIERTVSYFKQNMIDDKISLDFLKSLQSQNFVEAVLLKSTIYTIHQKEFSQIRNYILENSSIIVQDDSGIPLKALNNKEFEIKKYGYYEKPYGKEFKHYTQKILKDKPSEDQSKLSFCFGYGCGRTPSMVLIATKPSK